MDWLEGIIEVLDVTLDTDKRRHIVGGLALTAMTIENDTEDKEDE